MRGMEGPPHSGLQIFKVPEVILDGPISRDLTEKRQVEQDKAMLTGEVYLPHGMEMLGIKGELPRRHRMKGRQYCT
jgi:hypothetical protein